MTLTAYLIAWLALSIGFAAGAAWCAYFSKEKSDMNVEIKILDPRLTSVDYATPGAAAIDLRACRIIDGVTARPMEGMYSLRPGEQVKIGTGIAMHLGSLTGDDEEPWHEAHYSVASFLIPRSGIGTKSRIRLSNTVGLVDSDYQGEMILAVENGGTQSFIIHPLDRICQAAIIPILRPTFNVVDEFSADTARGEQGFGHTGVA